jgi:polysaccharide biosynthesis/export protein
MRTWTLAVLAAAAVAVPLPAAAQNAPPAANDRIHPGDLIRLEIWREPDLSGRWTVPVDGIVVFPRVGPRNVLDRSIDDVKNELLAELERYLINPSILLEVHRKVQILGAVRTPGVYTLDPTFTISDALAAAGGVSPDGRQDRVELRRDDRVVMVLLQGRTPLSDAPIRSGDQLFVPERSYVGRNLGSIAALVTGTLGVLIAVLAR